jgi:peptidoglycan hydrolase CwlO-like protein
MKRTLLALAMLLLAFAAPVSSFAQESISDSAKIEQLISQQYNQLKRLVFLESTHKNMSADLDKLSSSSDELSSQVKETLERLAQSESAINATLETFQQKFDDQNKTIEEVQALLDSKMDQMLMYIGIGIAGALVLMFVVARSATATALKSHQANWNAFQEHLFKSK